MIELKIGDFESEHAGKLNFYIKAVDELLRKEADQPTIGILLCKNKDRLVAEYALSDIQKPIGVSEYQLTQSLPKNLQSKLPSIQDLENELSSDLWNYCKKIECVLLERITPQPRRSAVGIEDGAIICAA